MTVKQLFIPEIGTELTLAEDWTFCLYAERRNLQLGIKLKYALKENNSYFGTWYDVNTNQFSINGYNNDNINYLVTLSAGTILKVDRIYIRKGNKEYSSITFYGTFGKNKLRFWAKLEDVNKIKFQ